MTCTRIITLENYTLGGSINHAPVSFPCGNPIPTQPLQTAGGTALVSPAAVTSPNRQYPICADCYTKLAGDR